MVRVLHTSDWHLGRTLITKRRLAEHEQFLDWLTSFIEKKDIHILLIAGDVFDTTTPSNAAQQVYYNFLSRIAAIGCQIVVTAGNHDSPTFLTAAENLLRSFHIHVIGTGENPQDEVIILHAGAEKNPVIIGAVPYLRDKDVRNAEAGESLEDKSRKLVEGIAAHYQEVYQHAEKTREKIGAETPIFLMGHLFVAGGEVEEGDGVRTIHVGALAGVPAHIFSKNADYVALGHLHRKQLVQGQDTVRYSGSPLPMSFNEAGKEKYVCLVECKGRSVTVHEHPVPVFQELASLKGDMNVLHAELKALIDKKKNVWVEAIYTGVEVAGDLAKELHEQVQGSQIEILRIKDSRRVAELLAMPDPVDMKEISPTDVFMRCLDVNAVPQEQHAELLHLYQEILTQLDEQERE